MPDKGEERETVEHDVSPNTSRIGQWRRIERWNGYLWVKTSKRWFADEIPDTITDRTNCYAA